MTLLQLCSTALVGIAVFTGTAHAQTPAAAKAATAPAEKVPVLNLNTASVAELEKLPGIGAKVAARIVDYRTKKGPFHKTEELMNVQGIGEKSFLKLRSQLTVGTPAAPSQQ